jgi:hypothetical protein
MTARNTSRKPRSRRNIMPIPPELVSGVTSTLGGQLTSSQLKKLKKAFNANPGKGYFERCVAAVKARGGAVDPKAVCAAQAMRTPAGKKELQRAAKKGRMKHKRNWPWSKTTYSAATGTSRKVSSDKKEEARLRKQERADAARIRQAELRERQRERAEQRKEELHRKRIEAAEARTAKAREKKERAAEKKSSGSSYPSLFGTPYAKLSPSQQALVRRATANKGRKKNPKRRNPEDAAAARYEYFHGRGPDSITEVKRTVREHSVLSGIGKLNKLTIAAIDGSGRVELSKFKGALLAQNEAGTQMYIEGGDQSVNLADFGIRKPHEKEILGACLEVWYDTTKDHLGKDGGTATYHHKFGGKKNGKASRLPMIGYDVRNKQLEFLGGGYTLPDVGIDG